MSEQEYIVSLHRGVDAEQFNQEMIALTGDGMIPNRPVDVANARPGSYRNTHYSLTEEEAKALRNDPRVYGVEINPEHRDDIRPMIMGLQEGNFNKTSVDSGQYYDWGKIRHSYVADQYAGGTTTSANWPYAQDGTGVDVVIQDSGLQVDHPEFAVTTDADYNNGSIINVTGNGSDFFKREVTVNGVRIMGAGSVGGQTAVPDAWLEKVARMFELFLNPNSPGINKEYQRIMIKTLRGDSGTYHANAPTIQRVARGAGDDYSTNFLTDAGIIFWNLTDLYDTHVQNDMVWYLNSTGDGYGNGDIDAQEVIEHVFHTLHMHGLPAEDIKLYPFISSDWNTSELYAAMEEAYDAGKWDPSGYQQNPDDWKTDGDAFEVAAKEYLYLLNFCMFEYTSLWDGGSLSPEWTDDMRTQAGIQANNPLGYAFHNKYIAPVISRIPLNTIRSIFQDGNTPSQDNPAIAGGSGYVPDTGYRVHQIDWDVASGLPFTQSSNHYRDTDGHGTHCAGTAVGKTFGWAKNARIYSVKVSGLEGTGDSGTGISVTYVFDCIKLWHRNKPVDPVTGVKRPTIVNMSWGYGGYYQFGTGDSIVYRGTTYSGTQVDTVTERRTYGLPGISYGTFGGQSYYRYNSRVASVDTDIQELIDEGVHVCIAAGNYYYLRDLSTGADYNNICFADVYNFGSGTFNPSSFYYHRGGSPYDDEAFTVGNMNSTYTSGIERKADSSECGPAVNIYAAGTNIISCTSTTNKFSDAAYYADSNYRQTNISGTSMASPQVCGLGALYLQSNPELTPAQLREMIINDSVKDQLNDTGATSYNDFDSIMGGNNRILNSRYAKQNAYTTNNISGNNVGFD